MKKVLVILLSLMMAMTVLTACGQTGGTDEPAVEAGEAGEANEASEAADVLSNPTLTLGDSQLEFGMKGNYTEGSTDIDLGEGVELLWAYDGDDDSEYRYVRAYKWQVGDTSLIDESTADALYYFPEQEPEVITCDFWQEPGDCEYTYYVGIKNDELMMQVWTFMQGDYFYQICAGIDLVEYTVDGTDLHYAVPKRMTEIENDLALKAFVDPDYEADMSEFPNVAYYLIDENYDFSAENIAKEWGVDNVTVVEHEFSSNDGSAKIPGYIIDCEYTEDGKTLVCHEEVIKTGDKYFEIEFTYNKGLGFADYIENSYRAFCYTIAED